MKIQSLLIIVIALLIGIFGALQLDQALSFVEQWRLLLDPAKASSFAEFNFVYAQLPRVVIAIMVGACLGLVGSLMQQLTQNSLTSPLTLGTSSGAWLALVVVSIWLPNTAADGNAVAAMLGAMLAFTLIVLINGLNNMAGLGLVVSGMVVNILLGAIASAIILLNREFASHLFMWGAGDLAQNGWDWVLWLLPRISLAVLLLIFAPRVLTLMRLGQRGAASRGLAVVPVFFGLMLCGIWLVSAAITAVGLIGFIGLLAPNIARMFNPNSAKAELYISCLLGALFLLLTDILSIILSLWFSQVVPSGVTAAAIGAPALLWFSLRKYRAQDNIALSISVSRAAISYPVVTAICAAFILAAFLYFSVHISVQQWSFAPLSDYQWSLRWPRALTAISTGVGLAIAGCILQRIIYNPLASPDILGVSAGATFTLVFASLFMGQALLASQWLTALVGSLVVLGLILALGRRHQYAPSSVILMGISITALLQAFVQFFLAKGNQDSYKILQWLAGSTYRVTPSQALLSIGLVIGLLVLAFSASRWLTLISISRSFAGARGLNTRTSMLWLLLLVALLCAVVTATMGPVSFVGLIAPHMAMMLGATQIKSQLALASLVGATLMLWSDWAGQVLLHPNQIAAGTIVAILGSSYFLLLLVVSRLQRRA
ncbi:MAG: Fe(3+)-hydroxamate ABC transporter permease FhuB [Oceanospirillaceae bacterium]|nr:Fe(3+)-hydroxamate ABC transporter permease FhuB [Oceanospirillaceae bacterium]